MVEKLLPTGYVEWMALFVYHNFFSSVLPITVGDFVDPNSHSVMSGTVGHVVGHFMFADFIDPNSHTVMSGVIIAVKRGLYTRGYMLGGYTSSNCFSSLE